MSSFWMHPCIVTFSPSFFLFFSSSSSSYSFKKIIFAPLQCCTEEVQDFILDCEAVAIERATGQIRPFQILSTRKRKDADSSEITVQVTLSYLQLLVFFSATHSHFGFAGGYTLPLKFIC